MDTRPQRANGVQLLGEMPATGYTEAQWLVQHEERFLQLSELPYRVLDLADGQRTLPDIATELTLMTECGVQPGDVAYFVDKLRALGLITGDSARPDHPPDQKPRPPLQLSLRMKLLPRRLVDGLTRMFQHFYSRWLLLLLYRASMHIDAEPTSITAGASYQGYGPLPPRLVSMRACRQPGTESPPSSGLAPGKVSCSATTSAPGRTSICRSRAHSP